MTEFFHDPEKGLDASKILKLFKNIYILTPNDWIIS
jgi:hypothetical protein